MWGQLLGAALQLAIAVVGGYFSVRYARWLSDREALRNDVDRAKDDIEDLKRDFKIILDSFRHSEHSRGK